MRLVEAEKSEQLAERLDAGDEDKERFVPPEPPMRGRAEAQDGAKGDDAEEEPSRQARPEDRRPHENSGGPAAGRVGRRPLRFGDRHD